jgi:hypothetical protein
MNCSLWWKNAGKYLLTFLAGAGTALFAAAGFYIKTSQEKVVHGGARRCGSRDKGIDDEKIDNESEEARLEACDRIAAAPARSLCESYGTVCDAIDDGKNRFRKRAGQRSRRTDTGGMAGND